MSRRVSRKRLEFLVEQVVKLQGRPAVTWTRAEGKNIASVGAIHLDYAAVYGGWDLVELQNEAGGQDSLVGNTFGGRGRLKSHEMESFLLGMLKGIEGYKPV